MAVRKDWLMEMFTIIYTTRDARPDKKRPPTILPVMFGARAITRTEEMYRRKERAERPKERSKLKAGTQYHLIGLKWS